MEVGLQLDLEGAESAELDRLTRLLRDELNALDVEGVELVTTAAPNSAKAFGLVEIGSIVISVAGRRALVAVVDAVRSWAGRSRGRTAKLTLNGDEIELTGISAEQQERLIDAWLTKTHGESNTNVDA
jgi:hypothetical protein